MFYQNTYIGLDMSDLSVKAVQFRAGGNKSEIVSYGSINLSPGLIRGGKIENPQSLSIAIKDLFANIKGSKIKTKYVGCSLPEEKSFVRLISLPLMSEKELQEAIKWAAETEIPIKLDELYLGWELIERHDTVEQGEDPHIDVLLVASPKEIVDEYVNFLKELNLVPILTEIESSLVVESIIDIHQIEKKITKSKNKRLLFSWKHDKNTKNQNSTTKITVQTQKDSALIVDIGAHRTNFIIFNGKTICFTSTTPIAGNSFNEALIKELKIDTQEAEKIKNNIGLDKEEKQGEIFQALVPPLNNLIEEINKVIHYYQEHHVHAESALNVSKIIICGGGALLKGLSSHLQTALNINVELGNPWINFEQGKIFKRNEVPIIPREISLSYTTAIGIALSIKKEYY